jgi:hypothetical protein
MIHWRTPLKYVRLIAFLALVLASIISPTVVFGQPGTDYCSTDRSYYNVGDAITIAGHLGLFNPYYIYVFKPDGSVAVMSLGNGPGSFSIQGSVRDPQGPRRVELWMSTIEIFGGSEHTMDPRYDVTCNTFTVVPEFPVLPLLLAVSMLAVAILVRRVARRATQLTDCIEQSLKTRMR